MSDFFELLLEIINLHMEDHISQYCFRMEHSTTYHFIKISNRILLFNKYFSSHDIVLHHIYFFFNLFVNNILLFSFNSLKLKFHSNATYTFLTKTNLQFLIRHISQSSKYFNCLESVINASQNSGRTSDFFLESMHIRW